ncbi:MAG: endospore germination permease [Candidatus Pristimantibacillus sp.]
MQTAVKPFGLWPVIMMFTLTVGLANHVIIIPLLLDAAKRDAWLSIPVALIISLPMAALPLYHVLKRLNGERLDLWMRKRMPAFVVWCIMAIMLLMLLFVAFGTLVDVTTWTANTYLPLTPPIVVGFVLCMACLYAAVSGLRTIAYVSCILLPVVVVLGDFVMSANMPAKDYHYLLPMLEYGVSPVLKGAAYSLSSFSELTFLLLIQHHFKSRFKRWHLLLFTLFLMMLTIGPAAGAITEFGPKEAEIMRYPAYSEWRLVKIGKYVEHVDFFAVFQWLSGAFVRISMPVYIISEFGFFRKMERKWIGMLITVLLLLTATYFIIKKMMLYRFLMEMYFLSAWIILGIIIILLWVVSFRKRVSQSVKGGKQG